MDPSYPNKVTIEAETPRRFTKCELIALLKPSVGFEAARAIAIAAFDVRSYTNLGDLIGDVGCDALYEVLN